VDLEAHERAQRLGEELDYSGKSARSIEPIVQRCVDFIEKINEAQKPLVIGGFSQGAMLATQLILALPRPPKALVILSGTIFDRVHLESGFSSRNDFVYFQSHGRSDEVLPFSGAERLHEVLDAAGVHGEFIEFKGGHDIPMTVIQKLDRFLGGLAFSK
jgi:phospholipase/carboxylesterase